MNLFPPCLKAFKYFHKEHQITYPIDPKIATYQYDQRSRDGTLISQDNQDRKYWTLSEGQFDEQNKIRPNQKKYTNKHQLHRSMRSYALIHNNSYSGTVLAAFKTINRLIITLIGSYACLYFGLLTQPDNQHALSFFLSIQPYWLVLIGICTSISYTPAHLS